MLREITPVKQDAGEYFRRLFSDEFFDLFVWYDAGQIIGFQLCYDKQQRECALTYLEDKGYSHARVDSGEDSVYDMRSPVLTKQGGFPSDRVGQQFIARSEELEPSIRLYVTGKLEACDVHGGMGQTQRTWMFSAYLQTKCDKQSARLPDK